MTRSHRSLRPAAALLALATLAGCAVDPPATTRASVSFDVRSLASDIVSVLGSARLTIESGGESSTSTRQLGGSDSLITFDVTVREGTARFLLDVLSNNQTLLYHADETETVAQDGFAVALTPQAVNPVLVVSPKNPAFFVFTTGSEQIAVALLRVRNAGPGQLRWNVARAAPDSVRTCILQSNEADCFNEQVWNPPRVIDSLAIAFRVTPGNKNRTIRFDSNVGQATFTVTLP